MNHGRRRNSKKRHSIFCYFLIVITIVFLICFLFDRNDKAIDNPNTPIEVPSDGDAVNESGIYGLFVNIEDANSYLELKENGEFTFVMNVCEGYVTYNNENSVLIKSVENNGDFYNVSFTIKSNSFLGNNVVKFSGLLVSTGVVEEYTGPYSCSGSYNYKKTLD